MNEEPKELKELAIEAIENLSDGREMHWINHLLEDSISTSRVQHILAFLSEVSLQNDHEDFCNAMTRDAMQGLGWILQSCHQALALQEELMGRERQKRAVRAVE